MRWGTNGDDGNMCLYTIYLYDTMAASQNLRARKIHWLPFEKIPSCSTDFLEAHNFEAHTTGQIIRLISRKSE